MRLGKTFIILLVIVLVVLLGLLAYMNMGGGNDQETIDQQAQQQPQVNTVDVLFLTRPVARGDIITADALGRLPYPAELLYIGVYTADREEEVIGTRAKFSLEQGMYLTNRMLTDELVGSEKSLEIEPGKVAVPVPISRFTSLGYGLEVGDHVDVITTLMYIDLDPSFQTALPNNTGVVLSPAQEFIIPAAATDQYGVQTSYQGSEAVESIPGLDATENLVAQVISLGSVAPQGRAEYDAALQQPMYIVPSELIQRPRILSQMTIQNAMILHFGNTEPEEAIYVDPSIPTVPTEDGTPPEVVAISLVPDLVTLVVSPQEAVVLNYLIYAEAEIMLALRSAYDNNASPVYTDAVTLDYLMNIYNIPVPNKLDYGLQPRVDELDGPVLDNDREMIILP